jgi:hypothetical protein
MDKTDTKILKLKNGGGSLRQIAKQVGISHVAVKKRLDRLTVNKTCSQEASAIAEPAIDDCKIPQADIWDTDEYPELNHAVTEIDGLIIDIEQFVRNKLGPESKSLTIQTPNGWKIEKIPAVG